MMMFKCRRIRSWLPLAVGGDLPPHLIRQCEQHIRLCSSCHALYQDLLASHQALEKAAHEVSEPASGPPPSVLWPSLEPQLRPHDPSTYILAGFPMPVRHLAAAALLLAVVATSAFLLLGPDPPGPATPGDPAGKVPAAPARPWQAGLGTAMASDRLTADPLTTDGEHLRRWIPADTEVLPLANQPPHFYKLDRVRLISSDAVRDDF